MKVLEIDERPLKTRVAIYCHQQSNTNMAFVLDLITMSSPQRMTETLYPAIYTN